MTWGLLPFEEHRQPPEVFYKKGTLKNFAKFTGKHLCQSLFFNKVAGLLAELQNTFFIDHLWATASNTGVITELFIIIYTDCEKTMGKT